MASSMTMPVASESASIVMLLSEKPSARITANVPMIEIGIASAGDDRHAPVAHEEEHDQRGQEAAEDQVVLDLLERLADEAATDRGVGRTLMSDGSVAWIRSSRAMTRSTTSTVLVPDCLRIDIEMAFSPSSRVWLRDFFVRVGDARDVAERDDRAVPVEQHDLLELADVAQPSHRAHRELRRPGDEAAAGDLGVLAVDRAGDLLRPSARRR